MSATFAETISHAHSTSENFRGGFDTLDNGLARGWAVDLRALDVPSEVTIAIDGSDVATVPAAQYRHDLQQAGHPTGNVGFEFLLPAEMLDGESHRIEVRYADGSPVPMFYDGRIQYHRDFEETWTPHARGTVDAAEHGIIRGWAVRSERGATLLQGCCDILVVCNGITVARGLADRPRPDVGNAIGAAADCGFYFRIAPGFRKSHFREFRCYLLPERIELSNSPCNPNQASDPSQAKLQQVAEAVDDVFAAVTKLRRSLQTAIYHEAFDVEPQYDAWARRYLSLLRARTDMARARRPAEDAPLVSIVCPTWQPDLGHFAAMIGSVQAQTYDNWELLLIDDASKRPELTACIARYAKLDPRIRALKRRSNGGISAATNDGIAEARGTWIAFLDHDDELVDVALELMVAAQRETGAQLLYSDEDKLTAAGRYVEPAFKPDFNLRLLLGQNYICHLTMVRTDVARAAGPFRPEFDGAQDHDFMLRLTEIVPVDRIHHVPEVLYHWRKAAGSTAGDPNSKPRAAGAGAAAIADYLKRRDLPGEVATVQGATRYHVTWTCTDTPSVNIVIPFRDQATTTRQCVDALQHATDYPNMRITLVDNGSTAPDAAALVERLKKRKNLRVLRVDEPFNFSRLCNIGARNGRADFVVFLNNDVVVQRETWLRCALAEALVDPGVGIVGAKLLYPSRLLQHGGVALGIGGVAGHLHTHIGEDDAGFMGRALVAQELSAVTGAAMLVRMATFEAIGGFDEVTFQIDYNDTDLCLRARAAGYKVIWTPDFVAEHHESLSRGSSLRADQEERFFTERQAMIDRWGKLLARDPFYSPHFDLYASRPFFDLREPTLEYRPQPML